MPVVVEIDGVKENRRLDIADLANERAVEYKTGYQTADEANLWAVKRDEQLVKDGWNVEWVFRDRASQPLIDALNAAGIRYRIGK